MVAGAMMMVRAGEMAIQDGHDDYVRHSKPKLSTKADEQEDEAASSLFARGQEAELTTMARKAVGYMERQLRAKWKLAPA